MDDNSEVIGIKWPREQPPKVGDQFEHGGERYQIVNYSPTGLLS